jgi:hypothetical protein
MGGREAAVDGRDHDRQQCGNGIMNDEAALYLETASGSSRRVADGQINRGKGAKR